MRGKMIEVRYGEVLKMSRFYKTTIPESSPVIAQAMNSARGKSVGKRVFFFGSSEISTYLVRRPHTGQEREGTQIEFSWEGLRFAMDDFIFWYSRVRNGRLGIWIPDAPLVEACPFVAWRKQSVAVGACIPHLGRIYLADVQKLLGAYEGGRAFNSSASTPDMGEWVTKNNNSLHFRQLGGDRFTIVGEDFQEMIEVLNLQCSSR